MDSLKTSNRKEGNLKTYTFMKTFMRIEYNDLDEVGRLTIAISNLNQANILQELKDHQKEMYVRMEQNLKINMIEMLTGVCGQMKN